jgi:protein SCO1/2
MKKGKRKESIKPGGQVVQLNFVIITRQICLREILKNGTKAGSFTGIAITRTDTKTACNKHGFRTGNYNQIMKRATEEIMEILALNIANRFTRNVLLLLLLSSYIACNNNKQETQLPYYHTPDYTPSWEVKADTIHSIAPFEFTNQAGEKVSNDFVKGKAYVANFFFTTCPGICPKMTAQLSHVADSFRQNESVKIISFSVTPYIDSVAQLAMYAKRNHINTNQWQLLTGNKSEIYTLARQSYFAEEEPGFTKDSSQFLHTEHVVLVDQNAHIRGVYNGTLPLDMERLINDIHTLINQ